MNFEEFCNSNSDTTKLSRNDNFEKYNQNLQKNIKNNEKIEKNDANNQNFAGDDNKFGHKSELGLQTNFDENEIKEKMQKYQNMNQNELLTELLKESKKQKQNGNLDENKLEEIKNSMSAVLNDEQKNRLEELINLLR